ncbi:hypothetical protein KY361_03365 [Candidatus Woesearchaeota archaeon]|nr:hypothetical protein [Candidatus Woesearchaeota archaeon]
METFNRIKDIETSGISNRGTFRKNISFLADCFLFGDSRTIQNYALEKLLKYEWDKEKIEFLKGLLEKKTKQRLIYFRQSKESVIQDLIWLASQKKRTEGFYRRLIALRHDSCGEMVSPLLIDNKFLRNWLDICYIRERDRKKLYRLGDVNKEERLKIIRELIKNGTTSKARELAIKILVYNYSFKVYYKILIDALLFNSSRSAQMGALSQIEEITRTDVFGLSLSNIEEINKYIMKRIGQCKPNIKGEPISFAKSLNRILISMLTNINLDKEGWDEFDRLRSSRLKGGKGT